MSDTVTATAYLQVVPTFNRYYKDANGNSRVMSARVVGVTQSRPRSTREASVIVKVSLRMPVAAFQPLQPEAVIDIPLDLIQQVVEVTAEG